MFKNQLANYERYSKDNLNQYKIDSSYSVYEVYIEVSHDKDGNVMKNKDGSERYHAVDDSKITALEEEKVVKVIRDGYYKDVYQVNGDYVEKVERDGKRIYFVVPEEKVTTLAVGTKVVVGNGVYREPKEVGYVLVNDTDIENPKIVAVRKFATEDHKKEAEEIVRNGGRRRQPKED